MANTTTPIEMPTGIAIADLLVVLELFDASVVAEFVSELKLEVKLELKLEVKPELKLALKLELTLIPLGDNVRGNDEDDISDIDEDDKEIDFAVPNFDPMENKLKALIPGQQLRLYWAVNVAVKSQHINPPSPGHLFVHPHTTTPPTE